MSVMTAPSYEAALDSPPPLPYGLFSVAEVLDRSGGHWQQGVEVDASPACLLPRSTGAYCQPAPDKQTDNAYSVLTGDPFVVYVLNSCRTVGRLDDAVSRAREALLLGDSYAAERGMAQVLDARAPSAVDVNGPIADAIAYAEQYAAQHYTGQAILHMNRQVATWAIAQRVLFPDGQVLRTGLGTPVVAGGGYSAEAASASTLITSLTGSQLTATLDAQGTAADDAPAMAGDIFITGAVRLYRGDISSHPLTVDLQQNTFYALAERTYVPVIDCFVGRVRPSSSGSCCPAGDSGGPT